MAAFTAFCAIQTSHGAISASGGDLVGSGAPGGGLVLPAVPVQATMQDFDKPVARGAQGLVVRSSAGSLPVVVGPSSGLDAEL
jgi:hypothetical protein